MLDQARRHGTSISFDPYLRPSLWPSEDEMLKTLNAMAAKADWILPGLVEGRLLTGLEAPHDIAGYYLDRGAKAVIIKLGPRAATIEGDSTDMRSRSSCPASKSTR